MKPSFCIEDAREAQATIEHALATLACGAPEGEGWERVCRRLRSFITASWELLSPQTLFLS